MNRLLRSPFQFAMAYLVLWIFLVGVLLFDGSARLSPVAIVIWLAVVGWWSSGSRIAQWVLLLGTLWTAIAIAIVDMSQSQSLGAVVALLILLIQLIVLILSFWTPGPRRPTQG
jgi:hypothetical protein